MTNRANHLLAKAEAKQRANKQLAEAIKPSFETKATELPAKNVVKKVQPLSKGKKTAAKR